MIPAPGAIPRVKLPRRREDELSNGLKLVIVRRPGVPRVQVRLRVPVVRPRPGDGARERLLAATIDAGTREHDAAGLARAFRRLGSSFAVQLGTEELVASGATLAAELDDFLGLVAAILHEPTFPADAVRTHQRRVAQELTISRNQPGVLAGEALRRRLWGEHPYGRPLPDADAVQAVTPAALRRLLRDHVGPSGAVLVLVGDLPPARMARLAEKHLGSWAGRDVPAALKRPSVGDPGPIVLVDRPGSVQTAIRFGGPAPARGTDGYAEAALANLVFGGYFSSRLVANLREDKGYTYSPRSLLEHRRVASAAVVRADVGTEVTAPALVEIRHELERLAVVGPTEDEVESAKRYLLGSMVIGLQTQAGLASRLAELTAAGLGAEYLLAQSARLAEATVDGVRDAAARILAGRRLHVVLVGDAEQVAPALEPLAEVEVA